MKPVPRILDCWLKVAGFRTAYGVSQDMGTGPLRRNVDRWRKGEKVPSLATLHHLVDRFAAKASWLDDSPTWKTRFTLACAMQNLCDTMDVFFEEVCKDSSLKLAGIIKRISEERIVCDDEKFLADPYRFFAARLAQLKLKRDGKWEMGQMSPGNNLLESIKNMAVSDARFRHNDGSVGNFIALEEYLFNDVGVNELNCLIKLKREKDGRQ